MPNPGLIWEDGEDRKVLVAPGLRLIFSRAADRWTHSLELIDGGGSTPTAIAWSLETEADRSGPAMIVSPVYQEIQPHDLGDSPRPTLCALLTGKLYEHHFSAAVTVSIDTDTPGEVAVDWDVADRCRVPVSHLAATYQLPMGSGDLADADDHSASWSGDRLGHGRLEFLAGPSENVALSEAGRNGSRIQAVMKVVPGVFTHRLRYRWRWRAGADVAILPGG